MKKTMLMFDDEQSNKGNSPLPVNDDLNQTMIIGSPQANATSSGGFAGIQIKDLTGWLVVTNGKEKGAVYELSSGDCSIGRDTHYTIPLMTDKSVSRKVCAIISWHEERHCHSIIPFQVSNPSYLNKVIVDQEAELTSYDMVTVGRSDLLYVNPFR